MLAVFTLNGHCMQKEWCCPDTKPACIPSNQITTPSQSGHNSRVFKGGCSCNVDVVLVVEVAKRGERGGLEYERVLLHSAHLHREGAVSDRIVPSIGNWEGRRGVDE